jgi:hypothetical protein
MTAVSETVGRGSLLRGATIVAIMAPLLLAACSQQPPPPPPAPVQAAPAPAPPPPEPPPPTPAPRARG